MSGRPVVYGADYSVYVRIVRLVLEEKGVGYDLVPIDAFAEGGPGKDYLHRQPFGRIPAFEHSGFRLYETGAIARYVDEAFEGPALQPVDPKKRARMNQIVGIADSYAYRAMVWDVYVERVNKPQRHEVSDESRIATALIMARTILKAITDLAEDNSWLVGGEPTLADLYLAAMLDYFLITDEGRNLFQKYSRLQSWWSAISARPSMSNTQYQQ